MVKYQFNKNWSWCSDLVNLSEITDKHVDIVYRLDSNPCYFGSCKTNCSTNPFCLNGLGEKKLINLLQKEPDAPIERKMYFKDETEFVGLVNLGATCYINAYLQVWFNNIFFRECILGIDFDKIELEDKYLEDNLANNSETMPDLKLKSNDCLATNLQLIFSLMKETIRKSIDPGFFIKALGLDENIQQDAQEFSQLFLTNLQSILKSPNVSKLANPNLDKLNLSGLNKSPSFDLIQDLFQGEYKYITECGNCKTQSTCKSNFIELTLNIQNSQTIQNCIDDLLKNEIMDGDNQYYCDNCKLKCNATRMTKLEHLPPILNLQLLRFVYDRNSGIKKKLSTKIKFSEFLDLNGYLNKNNNLYHLGAILMHVGKTAYSGHYTAQIKNFQSNEWFNFNDEVITKLKKKQQLGSTEEETEPNKTTSETESQSSKSFKTFSTSNAYLLVYYRSDLIEKIPNEDLIKTFSSNQSQIIQVDNELLENWFKNLNTNKAGLNEIKNTERTLLHSIYENLWLNQIDPSKVGSQNQKKLTNRQKTILNNNKEIIELNPSPEEIKQNEIFQNQQDKSMYYFIPIELIKKLITGEFNQTSNETTSNNFTSKYLCSHKLLNPLAINRVKLVSKKGLDLICNVYSTSLNDIGSLEAFNNSTTRCFECIYSCFDYLKCKENLKQEVKFVKNLLKFEYNQSNDVILIDNETEEQNKENLIEKKNQLKTWYWCGKESLKQWQNLVIKKYEARLSSIKFIDSTSEATKPDIIEENHEAQNLEIQEIQNIPTQGNSSNPIIETSSNSVINYFNEDIICPHSDLSPTPNKRLVCSELWDQVFFKYFYFNAEQNEDKIIFTNNSNECRLCLKESEDQASKKIQVKNQKEILQDLYYNKQRPNILNIEPDTKYFMVLTDFVKEWRSLIKHSKYKDIKLFNQMMVCEHGRLPFNEYNFDASMCCLITADEWNYLSKNYNYDLALSVSKIRDNENNSFKYEFNPNVCLECMEKNEIDKYFFENKKIMIRQIEEDDLNTNTNIISEEVKSKHDNDDCEIIHLSCKKPRLDFENEDNKPIIEYLPSRRSKRSRKLKGDLEVVASSYSIIKNLKIQIASQLSRIISEQHLYFNNIELENEKTLMDYKINKGDLLYLKLDPVNTSIDDDSTHYEMAHVPEVGFKGSNLLR